MQIDLEPNKHSSNYELKPIHKGWLLAVATFTLAIAFGAGFARPTTWALVLCGILFGWALVLTFPRLWLSKIKD